jgi:uncharacterized tellurite resistance protein B-like protein
MAVMNWREWLVGRESTAETSEPRTEVVGRIASLLEELPPDRARFVAAFAYHLARIAHADHLMNDAERDMLSRLVVEESGLPGEEIADVIDLVARESWLFRGTEDYRVMREFDALATREQKLGLIRCLFAISAADEEVVTKEDNEIRRIALALKISHEEFVAARATVREHLAVLRKTGGIR